MNCYKVGQDEFSYSVEEPGIQMTFNKEINFDKAKKIGDEVISNIIATGQQAELLILDKKEFITLTERKNFAGNMGFASGGLTCKP